MISRIGVNDHKFSGGRFARNATQSVYPSLWNNLQGCWDFRAVPQANSIVNFGKNVAVSSMYGTPGCQRIGKGGLTFNNANDSAYTFNGATRVFNFGTGPFSIAAGFILATTTGQRGLITQIDNSATAGDFYIYFFNGDLKIRCGRRSTTSALSCQALTNALTAGVYYNIVMTSPTTDDVSVYVDGEFIQRVTSTGGYATASTTKTVIGQLEDIATRCWDGTIFYIYAWGRVLPLSEIRLLAQGASPLSRARRAVGKSFVGAPTAGANFYHQRQQQGMAA